MAILILRPRPPGGRSCVLARGLTLIVLAAALFGSPAGWSAEPALSEYQVKSLFLFNFAKYVDWPANAFAATNSPIAIGLISEGKIGPDLARLIAGKQVDGRPIRILPVRSPEDWNQCHILFIGSEEKINVQEILNRIKSLPVLTVGEGERFLDQGGVINFVKKEGKVRLEIDLAAARNAKLQISSKLLAVADMVKRK